MHIKEPSGDEEDVHLLGFSTADDDSSDEDDAMGDEPSGLMLANYPPSRKTTPP